jgi:C4-dicarboxylate-specific signal transduction histidine kinase
MKDFETHDMGTGQELRLSRILANAVANALDNPNVELPHDIVVAYQHLLNHYTNTPQ